MSSWTRAVYQLQAIICLICGIIIIYLLIKLLCYNQSKWKELRLFSVIPIFLSLIICLSDGLLVNNSLFNWINVSYYDHILVPIKCNFINVINIALFLLIRFFMTSFFIGCLRYFFMSSTLEITRCRYYGLLSFHGMVQIAMFLMYMTLIPNNQRGHIYTATDTNTVLYCSNNTNHPYNKIIIIYITFIECIVQSILLYVYYVKCNQYNKIYLTLKHDDNQKACKLSRISARAMKRNIYFGTASIASSAYCGVTQLIDIVFTIPFPVALTIQSLWIVYQLSRTSVTNEQNNEEDLFMQSQDVDDIFNVTEEQQRELQTVWTAFRATPKRKFRNTSVSPPTSMNQS